MMAPLWSATFPVTVPLPDNVWPLYSVYPLFADTLKVAPEETLIGVLLAMEPPLDKANVPAWMVVAAVYVLAPERVHVPPPLFIMLILLGTEFVPPPIIPFTVPLP
jgi:hypothetical protein